MTDDDPTLALHHARFRKVMASLVERDDYQKGLRYHFPDDWRVQCYDSKEKFGQQFPDAENREAYLGEIEIGNKIISAVTRKLNKANILEVDDKGQNNRRI